MLYNIEGRTIIYCPYKNYSTSLTDYYCNRFGDTLFKHRWQKYIGKAIEYNYVENVELNFHSTPPRDTAYFQSFTKFLPVRNPYERVPSQYHWSCKQEGYLPFDYWLRTKSKDPRLMPVSKIFGDCLGYDYVIQVENIVEGLREYNLVLKDKDGKEIEFPKSNVTKDRKDKVILTPFQKDFIYYLHYEDFKIGGYDR